MIIIYLYQTIKNMAPIKVAERMTKEWIGMIELEFLFKIT